MNDRLQHWDVTCFGHRLSDEVQAIMSNSVAATVEVSHTLQCFSRCEEHQSATCPNVASEKLLVDFDVQAYKTPCQVVEQAEVVALHILCTWPMFVRWYSNILQQICKSIQNCKQYNKETTSTTVLYIIESKSLRETAPLWIGPKLNGKGRRHRYSQCSMNPLQVCQCVHNITVDTCTYIYILCIYI